MKRLSLILFIALCVIKQSYALQISEIMYDPSGSDTGHEWIEIYNDGEVAVDVKTLKLYENNTNHSITYVSGNEMLQKGEYAVIADNASFFSIDNPSFTGNLFDCQTSLASLLHRVDCGRRNDSLSSVYAFPVSTSVLVIG